MAYWVRETHWALTNQEIHSVLVPMEEGRNSDNHFEDQDTKRPPIDRKVVSISDKHLWGQIFSRTAERIGQFALLDELSQAKVSHKQVTYRKVQAQRVYYQQEQIKVNAQS